MSAPSPSSNEAALRRARKMLATAESTNAEEAANAMSAVSKYMAKFGFTMEQLRDSGVDKRFSETVSGRKATKATLPNWYIWLGVAISKLTDTRTVTTGNDKNQSVLKFQGMNGDDEVANMMFDYINEAMERQLKTYIKDGAQGMEGVSTTQIRLDYRRGFALALLQRCEEIKQAREADQISEQSEPGQSLVVVKTDLIRAHYTNVTPARKGRKFTYRSRDAYSTGSADAQTTSLNQQLGGSSQKRLA